MGRRERILILAALVIFLLVLTDRWVLARLRATSREAAEVLEDKEALLGRYFTLLKQEEAYQQAQETLNDRFQTLQNRLFMNRSQSAPRPFQTLPLASAEFQKEVKALALKQGFTATRTTEERVQEIFPGSPFVFITLRFEFFCNKFEKMMNLLYDLEYGSNYFFFIEEVQVREAGFRVIKGADVSLAITGMAVVAQLSEA